MNSSIQPLIYGSCYNGEQTLMMARSKSKFKFPILVIIPAVIMILTIIIWAAIHSAWSVEWFSGAEFKFNFDGVDYILSEANSPITIHIEGRTIRMSFEEVIEFTRKVLSGIGISFVVMCSVAIVVPILYNVYTASKARKYVSTFGK